MLAPRTFAHLIAINLIFEGTNEILRLFVALAGIEGLARS